jgi:acyl-CoA reductase-like NAD-dependent aldehyde dehydrogenase
MSIQTVNPNTNKTVKSFEEMTAVDAKVAKAHLAYANWKETSQQRADLLHKVAKLMRIKKPTCQNYHLRNGKPPKQKEKSTSADIRLLCDNRRFSCRST